MTIEAQKERIFPTSAAERYDRALRKSQKMTPLPATVEQPLPTNFWPEENVALLEKYRDWLIAVGAATAVINQHRIPVAGYFLGLTRRPLADISIDADKERTLTYIKAKQKSAMWERNNEHSLRWFCTFLRQEMGLTRCDKPKAHGNVERYQTGLPDWLLKMLTKQLHHYQGNWRRSRQALMTYQFWCKYTLLWRWLLENWEEGAFQSPAEIERRHIFEFIDEMLEVGYAPKTINVWLYSFQATLATLRFIDERGMKINQRLMMIEGLKVDDPLPRFLTTEQVTKVRHQLDQQVAQAKTHVQVRDSLLDRAAFTLLWQTGMRLSELEDLTLNDIDLKERKVTIRMAKGLKDRVVYLTDTVVKVLTAYLEVRGPALSDHIFIYRHQMASKDLVRLRVKAAGKRAGVYVTPHMLRHTFATQLLNSGCKIPSIQMLLGHKRLNTTMVYARVHDETLIEDYYTAMEKIEAKHLIGDSDDEAEDKNNGNSQPLALLDQLENGELDEKQRQLLEELRRCLAD